MNMTGLSIKHPAMITSVMIGLCAVGLACFKSLSIEMFPEVSIPVVSVTTVYPGAGPSEIETLISKPIEDEVSAISGIKRLLSKNLEGTSIVIVEFQNGVDLKYAEQQVRDKVSIAKAKLPHEIDDSTIKRQDPSDQPILTISLSTETEIGEAQLYDIADQFLKPRLEQVNNVGTIEILGGRKREVHVTLDRDLLRRRELSVNAVSARVGSSGENVPSGKVNVGNKEQIFRSLGEFESVEVIKDTLVSLYGNEAATRVSDVGTVTDSLEDEKTRAFVNGKKALSIAVYRQSGTNTLGVAEGVKKALAKSAGELKALPGHPSVTMVRDATIEIEDNVDDVYETIIIAILLTVVTVYFFLASVRATLITSLALPISLIGTFAFMYLMNFSINVISMLALSLAVGLLVDDAIVIVENIFRRIETGESPGKAAMLGTSEIQISVLAITLVVVSIFAPVGFMKGTVGQFMKQFGLTMALAMMVSFFVALTFIPMMTAYFAGEHSHAKKSLPWGVRHFDQFQGWLERKYAGILQFTLRHPLGVLLGSLVVVGLCFFSATRVSGGFLPDSDNGQVLVSLDLPSGTSLDGTAEVAHQVDELLRAKSSVELVTVTVGNANGEANKAELFVKLKKGRERGGNTSQWKEMARKELRQFARANPIVTDFNASGDTSAPVTIDIVGVDQKVLDQYAVAFVDHLKQDPRLKDVDSTTRPGRPEFQVRLRPGAAKTYGINTKTMGEELRAQVQGNTPAKFRTGGREYDVRVRLKAEQRNLDTEFPRIFVPNVNNKLVHLDAVSDPVRTQGFATIERQNRGRYVRVSANLAPGVGLGDVMNSATKYLDVEHKLPEGVRYVIAGQAENMQELQTSFATSLGFGIMFIYLILSSLYGSFITPFTIMLAFPLAICGAFVALFATGQTMSIFSILGIFLLLGVSGKNSILLIDYARQQIAEGKSRSEAILQAGITRLRPILMTSFALIAGTLPVAIGLNEASKQRTGMGIAIIGGLVSATLLTLIVVPAVFSYVDRYRVWSKALMAKLFKVTPLDLED